MGMNHRAGSSTPSEHLRHDQVLMARLAGDDLDPSERSTAEALRSACAECRLLHDDLRALMRAATDLPAPRRHRDFRLSPEQAARLRGSWLDRVTERLAAPSLGLLQPLAGAAMALGLTLLVLNALPSGGLFQAGGAGASAQAAPAPAEAGAIESPSAAAQAPDSSRISTDSAASPELVPFTSPTPSYRSAAGAPQPTPTSGSLAGEAPSSPPDEQVGATTEQGRDRLALEMTGPDWLVIGVLLFIAGLAVFLARLLAVRQMRDPRLQ